MRAIKYWTNLVDNFPIWSKEIKCETTKKSFLNFYSETLLTINGRDISLKKIESIRTQILNQFGSHIPSLKSEIRHTRIKELGI